MPPASSKPIVCRIMLVTFMPSRARKRAQDAVGDGQYSLKQLECQYKNSLFTSRGTRNQAFFRAHP
jgi:hypothetical protein